MVRQQLIPQTKQKLNLKQKCFPRPLSSKLSCRAPTCGLPLPRACASRNTCLVLRACGTSGEPEGQSQIDADSGTCRGWKQTLRPSQESPRSSQVRGFLLAARRSCFGTRNSGCPGARTMPRRRGSEGQAGLLLPPPKTLNIPGTPKKTLVQSE